MSTAASTPTTKSAEVATLAAGPHGTTLVYPVAVTDIAITVTSAAGIAIGNKVIIDSEILRVAQAYLSQPYAGTNTIPVLRGQSGTVTNTHPAGAVVTFGDAMIDFSIRSAPGLPTDFPGATPLSPSLSMGSKDTAIPLPKSVGFTSVTLPVSTTLTLALPTADLNGAMLTLVGNSAGTASLTVASTPTPTTPGGLAGATLGVAPGEAKLLLASGGNWIQFPTPGAT